MELKEVKEHFLKTIKFLEEEFANLRVLGAHPSLLSKVTINYFGTQTPLQQCATITAQGGTSLIVIPYDKTLIKEIISSIAILNIGLNGIEDGDKVRINIPPLSLEKRELFAKSAKEISEKARISIRNIRHDFLKKIKDDKSLREDERKLFENNLQKEVDNFNKQIDTLLKSKTDSLLKI